jgi:uncharacterized protein (TIGR00255 family)
MIASMTGYGGSQRCEAGVDYALEIRSVNNRYLKCSIKLPDVVQFVEPEMDKLIRTRLVRGSVSLLVRIRNQSESAAYNLNHLALSAYVAALNKVTLPAGASASIDLAALSALPGVCQAPELDEQQREDRRRIICEMADEAIDQLVAMREREGESLYEDLVRQCSLLGDELGSVQERAPVVVEEYHQRLGTRVESLMARGKFELEQDSLCKEIALYAERSDVSEEIVRLRAHLEHFVEIAQSGEAVGRRLDFLSQEMLRETNTIGSKSNDAAIARCVVEMKAIIDRIKEQVQNAE